MRRSVDDHPHVVPKDGGQNQINIDCGEIWPFYAESFLSKLAGGVDHRSDMGLTVICEVRAI